VLPTYKKTGLPTGTLTSMVKKWRLHPLIHTLPEFTQAQNIESIRSGAEAPHLLSLNQDIVAWSQEEKCGLKYVIHTPRSTNRAIKKRSQ
jgi:hypothetical protein